MCGCFAHIVLRLSTRGAVGKHHWCLPLNTLQNTTIRSHIYLLW